MTRILTIGDPHGRLDLLRRIPKRNIDLILLTGDLGKADFARNRYFENVERKKKGLLELEYTPEDEKKSYMEIYDSSMAVLRYLSKFAPVWFIFGNVEPTIKRTKQKIKDCGEEVPYFVHDARAIEGVRIINNTLANFNGVRIGGLEFFLDTNWVQDFKPSDYRKRMSGAKKQTDRAAEILKRFGKYDLDILLHHQPPYGVLDKVGGHAPKHWHGKHAGSRVIRKFIDRYQPAYAFCGHIHEGEGKKKLGKTEVHNLGVGGYKLVEFD